MFIFHKDIRKIICHNDSYYIDNTLFSVSFTETVCNIDTITINGTYIQLLNCFISQWLLIKIWTNLKSIERFIYCNKRKIWIRHTVFALRPRSVAQLVVFVNPGELKCCIKPIVHQQETEVLKISQGSSWYYCKTKIYLFLFPSLRKMIYFY